MDEKTSRSYSENARQFSDDWRAQPSPEDMYSLLKKFFLPEGLTADIGCGDGRDAYWLASNGFRVQGYDASADLIRIAHSRYPTLDFKEAYLPKLLEVTGPFDNVLCETVIMHLPHDLIFEAVESLKRILRRGGVLYLSWRVTEGNDVRSSDGRLYSAFEPALVLDRFEPKSRLHFEDVTSKSSGKRVCRLIWRNDCGIPSLGNNS